ncbi:hypothetical protein LguiA_002462 [Lonicera macranthoides]
MCSSEQQTVNVAGTDGGMEKNFYTMMRENNEGSSKSVVFDDGVGISENHGKRKVIERCNEGVGPISGGEINSVKSNGHNEFFDGGTGQLAGLSTRQREVIEERAEEGEISETGFQFENLSESEGDDYGDDYNSEEDNCGAVSFYQDKGGGWLASLFSEHQTRMSIGPSKIIADSVLSQGWQIIARRGRFSVPELSVSVCYDGGVVLRGLHLLSLTVLLNS